jgi:hypothetical protein
LPDLPLNFYTKAHFEGPEKKLAEAGPLVRPSKPATVNRYIELLRALLNLAIEDGELKENPLRFYHPFSKEGTRRALAEDEARAQLRPATQRANVLSSIAPAVRPRSVPLNTTTNVGTA